MNGENELNMAFQLSASVKRCATCAYLSRLGEVVGRGRSRTGGHVKSRLFSMLVSPVKHCVSQASDSTRLTVVRFQICQSGARTVSYRSMINPVPERLVHAGSYDNARVAAQVDKNVTSNGADQNKPRKADAVPTSAKSKTKKIHSLENEWIKPEGLDTGIVIYNSLTRRKEPLILPGGRLATW